MTIMIIIMTIIIIIMTIIIIIINFLHPLLQTHLTYSNQWNISE